MKKLTNLQPDCEVSQFMQGISGTCEATRFEQYTLYNEETAHGTKVVQERFGFGQHIATIEVGGEERQVYVSFTKYSFDGKWVLFWEAISAFVDHNAITEWFGINVPKVPRSDPMNFSNLINAMKDEV